MAGSPEVIKAIEAAVEAQPDNCELRLHLAELLLDAGRSGEAVSQCGEVLKRDPSSAAAARLAQRAVGVAPSAPLAERAAAERVPSGDDADQLGDELDDFLNDLLADADAGRVTLADVGGLEDVKERLHTSFLAPLRNRKLREMYGKSLRGGLLLYGPPGCGKTFLARALAGELGAHFLSVGLHDVLDMWLGNSEKNVHELFQQARARRPTVLFFDEVDALGLRRANLTQSAGRNVVVQLLNELDGFEDNDGVFVLGATNQPWDLDPALRRPGRFDRTILVVPPDERARASILSYHLRERPTSDGLDVSVVARSTDGYSGADLRLICEVAAERALWDSISLPEPRPIGLTDLVVAAKDVRPSTDEWFGMARNFVNFANRDGAYDELAKYMRQRHLL